MASHLGILLFLILIPFHFFLLHLVGGSSQCVHVHMRTEQALGGCSITVHKHTSQGRVKTKKNTLHVDFHMHRFCCVLYCMWIALTKSKNGCRKGKL